MPTGDRGALFRQTLHPQAESCLSIVALRILTGRRHQIRAHMAHIGHPLVCDGKYANEKFEQDLWLSMLDVKLSRQ